VKLARYAADGATFLGEVRYSNVRDLIQGSPKDDLLRLYLEGGNAAREIERQPAEALSPCPAPVSSWPSMRFYSGGYGFRQPNRRLGSGQP
jgi:hypothetical protein